MKIVTLLTFAAASIFASAVYADNGQDYNWSYSDQSANFLPTQSSASIMGDFNGDGKLDILSGGAGYNENASLYINDGNWTRININEPASGVALASYPHYCIFDYNNDGKLDILMSGVTLNEDNFKSKGVPYTKLLSWKEDNNAIDGYAMTALYENKGDNTFELVQNTGLPVIIANRHDEANLGQTSQPIPFATGDFDHDGYADIVFCGKIVKDGKEEKYNAVYYNNGDGTFTENPNQVMQLSGRVQVADLNNDGWLDIVIVGSKDVGGIYNNGGSDGRVFINNANGERANAFTDRTTDIIKQKMTRSGASALVDFNKDGYLDLITMGWCDNDGIQWANFIHYNNHGQDGSDNVFIDPVQLTKAENGLPDAEHLRIAVSDVNADGNLDIIFDGRDDNRVYYGSEDMKFVAGNILGSRGAGADDCVTAFGDVTGNGVIDRFQTGYQFFSADQMKLRHGGENEGYFWDGSLFTSNVADGQLSAPLQPQNVKIGYYVDSSEVLVQWEDINDLTVGYNVVIYNEANNFVIANVPADPTTSAPKVAEGKKAAVRPGVRSYRVKVPTDFMAANSAGSAARRARIQTPYKVGVQTLSLYNETYSAINWGDSGSVTGIDATVADENNVAVSVNGDEVMVKAADDCEVKVIDMLGRTVAAGVANNPVTVNAKGAFIVMANGNAVKICK